MHHSSPTKKKIMYPVCETKRGGILCITCAVDPSAITWTLNLTVALALTLTLTLTHARARTHPDHLSRKVTVCCHCLAAA